MNVTAPGVGCFDGVAVGDFVGFPVVGIAVGAAVQLGDFEIVGSAVGALVVGLAVGLLVGFLVGGLVYAGDLVLVVGSIDGGAVVVGAIVVVGKAVGGLV
jgi:hypothetical protein